jgi:proline-specific peptidase
VRVVEGRIPFHGYETWCRDVGPEGGIPLLCLHGGPGSSHHYFEPLEALAEDRRRVVVYDQLGCGNSDRPDDPDLWTVELFVDEVGAVRDALGLDRIHLLGTSWGSMLGIEYALTQPPGLVSLTLNSPPTSSQTWQAEALRLRDQLPEDVKRVLAKHEEAGTTDDPEYEAAEAEFWRRHICVIDPMPDCVRRGRAAKSRVVYEVLWGVSEWNPTGKLRDWDVRHRLPEIRVPTLVTSGRYDECTPKLAEEAQRGIPGAERVLFEESSHMAFVEEPERFRAVLTDFLERAEAKAA